MDSDNPLSGSSEADFVPKVFVSYSWAGKARAKRIADFLRTECGVDVVIDIYHLKPGQNKYAFMQRIVDDASIDRVLVLCDQAYQERANNFEGGVGDEATIISPKIYKDAKQTKFLPVVMEKDDEGNPYIPTFADGRIYLALIAAAVGCGIIASCRVISSMSAWGLSRTTISQSCRSFRWIRRCACSRMRFSAAARPEMPRRRRWAGARADGGLASTGLFRFAVCGSVPSDGRI